IRNNEFCVRTRTGKTITVLFSGDLFKYGNKKYIFSFIVDITERKNIEKRLDELPENQKTAFILNKIEGLSYEEVAGVMEINLNTVKSLIHRATMSIMEIKDE
ncbi:MAG: PAS domain S-box protein, partial [Deltaproteobacteria bacterium]|nr:PAS domain S-box protein [Deltaproteobacteria bacterium]